MRLEILFGRGRQSFQEFWGVRDSRERSMLVVAALVATFGLIYALLIDPALSGREKLNKNIPVLRQQVAQLQALSKEAATLSEKPISPVTTWTKENIETALAHNGLKPQSVMLTGDQAKIQLTAVSFAATLNWLDEMQKSARVSVADANIVALNQPDSVNVFLTLHQPAHE